MQSKAATIADYLTELPIERKKIIADMHKVITKNLPKGFEARMSYGMIGYVVPHSLYAEGYHCTPDLPLPFMNIASQKNFIALYHMCLYSNKKLLNWFTDEWSVFSNKKLDMGKSCIRFKNPEDVPLDLIGELAAKITPQEWITIYEKSKPR
jgi:hypothetical protein